MLRNEVGVPTVIRKTTFQVSGGGGYGGGGGRYNGVRKGHVASSMTEDLKNGADVNAKDGDGETPLVIVLSVASSLGVFCLISLFTLMTCSGISTTGLPRSVKSYHRFTSFCEILPPVYLIM